MDKLQGFLLGRSPTGSTQARSTATSTGPVAPPKSPPARASLQASDAQAAGSETPTGLLSLNPSLPAAAADPGRDVSVQRGDAKSDAVTRCTIDEAVELVSKDADAFATLPLELRNNPGLCRLAVQGNGFMLACVPEELRSRDVCMIAVKQDGEALKFVPRRLKADKELVLAAVGTDATAFQHLPGSPLFLDVDIRVSVETAAMDDVHAGRVALQYGIARSR